MSLSLESPATISNEAGLLKRMVAVVLNGPGKRHKVGRQTRLDVLHILANCALTVDDGEKNAVRDALSDVSAWFDEYMAEEGVEMDAVVALGELGAPLSPEPEIHKAMLVLLCRVFDYELRTEDLLELCRGNRRLALETVCGLLEDGEAVSTAVAQRQEAQGGQRAVCKLGGDARGEPPTPKISKLAPPPRADAPAPASYDDAPKVLSLLGDLPTLDAHRKDRKPKKKELKAFLDLDLEVPVAQLHVNNADHRAEQRALGYVQGDRGPLSPTSMKPVADGAVPRRLCCAINGHLMRDPVRARGKPHAPAFERETIELWLETRGSVCPITGAPLEKIDLAADAALRNEIVRYHIARTTLADEQDPFELIKASKTTNDKGEPQTPTPKARDDDAEADLYDF